MTIAKNEDVSAKESAKMHKKQQGELTTKRNCKVEKKPILKERLTFNKPKISIDDFISKLNGLECEEKYLALLQDAELIIEGKQNLLSILGPSGTGKTTVIHALAYSKGKQEGKDLKIIKGRVTPIKLYEILFQYRKKGCVLVLDDCNEVFENSQCAEILKAATDDKDHRLISYQVSSKFLEEMQLPAEFNFYGVIILIANKPLGKKNAAIYDRGFCHDLNLKPLEIIQYIRTFLVPLKSKGTIKKQRQEVLRRMECEYQLGATNFTCRTFNQLVLRYKTPLTFNLFMQKMHSKTPSDGSILLSVMDKHRGKPRTWKKEFMNKTNKCQRTYYSTRKVIKEELLTHKEFNNYKMENTTAVLQ